MSTKTPLPVDDLTNTLHRMSKYGGTFAFRLAAAGFAADADNLARLQAAFPELFERYGPGSEWSRSPAGSGPWRYDEPQQPDGQMCCALSGQVAVPRGDLSHGGWTYESWDLIRAGMPWMTIEDAEKYNDEHGPIPQNK